MDKKSLLDNLRTRMDGALKTLDNNFKGLRTGRASINLLDPVTVHAYGDKVPISQVSTVSAPDSKTINVQVWDQSLVKTVEKSIVDANLGVTTSSEGQLIRIFIPSLTEERRKELVKIAHKYSEEAKVSVRNVRRDGVDDIRRQEKAHEISEDEFHDTHSDIDKLTSEYTNKIDKAGKNKEQEILKV